MTDYAEVSGGAVLQVIPAGAPFTLADGVKYPANFLTLASSDDKAALGLVAVSTVGAPGDVRFYTPAQATALIAGVPTVTWTNMPRDLAAVKSARLLDLAALLDARLNGGCVYHNGGDIPLNTSGINLSLILGAADRARRGVQSSFNFADAAGVWHTVAAAGIEAVADYVATFIQACFDNAKAHTDAIAALTDPTAVIAYDMSTGWPG